MGPEISLLFSQNNKIFVNINFRINLFYNIYLLCLKNLLGFYRLVIPNTLIKILIAV
jgi:hypothetical protein